jgi:ubiquinone/menaquinone biosynthesis C-methylase UbiE
MAINNPVTKLSFCNGFCEPVTQRRLDSSAEGLRNESGTLYPYIDAEHKVIDFIKPTALTELDRVNLQMYNSENATDIYRNFLTWLFESFDQTENDFRGQLLSNLGLQPGMKILVTGCGLGEDIPLIMAKIGAQGELHAQDLSKSMVLAASDAHRHDNLYFSVSNGNFLPHPDRYFDAVFHFGGINLFGDVKNAIAELERVCKIGGRVVFGDEGIAPHLRGTQYADVAINNIKLWESVPPLHLLPTNALDIELKFLLGNCFYLLAFTPSDGFPKMNIDVVHKGLRGGSARTRYFGKIEGVSEPSKEKLVAAARMRGLSVHDLLEEIIASKLSDQGIQ